MPTRTEDVEKEQPAEIEVRRHEFQVFWEHGGEAHHVVLEAVFVGTDTTNHSICACGYCAKNWSSPAGPPSGRREMPSCLGCWSSSSQLKKNLN